MTSISPAESADRLIVGIAQIAPVWLDRDATILKVAEYVRKAAAAGCRLVAFGEALVPGYPFWLERTDGAKFESPVQKDFHARYLQHAVQCEAGHLQPICDAAAQHQIGVMVGCVERAPDRGGHSLYCSLVYINCDGRIQSIHRKLMPTYEERLSWAIGDGHGLRVHPLGPFTLGGLNCWENWMPLARAALYAQGEDLHVAIWPGSLRNTQDLTRFVAREGRSYMLSASGLLRREDISDCVPHRELFLANCPEYLANGGSCVAGPDGAWVIEPVVGREELLVATIDHHRVREERQNFDATGHYSRPDVLELTINRRRQSAATIRD